MLVKGAAVINIMPQLMRNRMPAKRISMMDVLIVTLHHIVINIHDSLSFAGHNEWKNTITIVSYENKLKIYDWCPDHYVTTHSSYHPWHLVMCWPDNRLPFPCGRRAGHGWRSLHELYITCSQNIITHQIDAFQGGRVHWTLLVVIEI